MPPRRRAPLRQSRLSRVSPSPDQPPRATATSVLSAPNDFQLVDADEPQRRAQIEVVILSSSPRRSERANEASSPVDLTVEGEESDSESELFTHLTSPRARGKQRATRNPRAFLAGGTSGSAPVPDRLSATPRAVKGKHRRSQRTSPSSEESEEPPRSAKTRRLTRRKGGRVLSQQERADLEEDLAVLPTSTARSRTRDRTARPKSAREKALEQIKRRRTGQLVEEERESEPEHNRRRRGLYDTDDGEDDEDDDEGDEDGDMSDAPPRDPATDVRRSLRWNAQGDEDDKNFIVEDHEEEDVLGAPSSSDPRSQIPIEFTWMGHRSDEDNLRLVVEWLVQKKINPVFDREDEIYRAAFERLDQRLTGYAKSKFMSSAWRPEFVHALEARPTLVKDDLMEELENRCEACNRTKHPATFSIKFEGKPYHKDTLEDVSDDEDDDEDEEDQEGEDGKVGKTDHDSKGRSIPDEDTEFLVGRFCAGNAEAAHQCLHWRFSLKTHVMGYLDDNGHITPEKILQRENWSTRKKGQYAMDIVTKMEEEKVLQDVYAMFQSGLNKARNTKVHGATWK